MKSTGSTILAILTLTISLSGCAYLDGLKVPDLEDIYQPEEEVDTTSHDAIVASEVIWHGVDIGGWPVTYSLSATASGKNVLLDTQCTDNWPSMVENVGSCWFIVEESDGKYHGYRWDQIRAWQKHREFPWNPPHPKDGDSYPTVRRGGSVFVTISSMARGNQRTVNERTQIVELKQ